MNRFRLPSDVSVIVRHDNTAMNVGQTLESLMEQTHPPRTILVLVPDHLSGPLSDLRPYLPYVKCCSPTSLASLPLREIGPYLMSVHSGEWLTATALEALELVLDVHDEVALVHGAWGIQGGTASTVPSTPRGKYRATPATHIQGPAVLCRTPASRPFDVIRMAREEWWHHLGKQNHCFYNIPHLLGYTPATMKPALSSHVQH
ncbi:MAG: hypothetical protein OWU33_10675 [Firmicutes bacterium]|nr:hypothetical protein [Bacillota bacterium]